MVTGPIRRPGVAPEKIREAIRACYRSREAEGLPAPTLPELWGACGTASSRVSTLHREMRGAGELPALALSGAQKGGMAAKGKGFARVSSPPSRPALQPMVGRHPSWRLVCRHMRGERFLRRLAAKAAECLAQQGRAS